MFMTTSLSNLVNNLSEGIHKIKWKYKHNDKKCETCRIMYEVCNCFQHELRKTNNKISSFMLYQILSTNIWCKVKATIF